MTSEEICQKFVAVAQSVVGLSADPGKPDIRQKYIELVAPGETPERQREMAAMSGCALTVAGVWRLAGVEHALLQAPYRTGTAVSRLREIAPDAWVAESSWGIPGPGDVILVGDNTAEGGIEHVYIVVRGPEDEHVLSFDTVEGGHRDQHGYELVVSGLHRWLNGKDVGYSPHMGSGRKIVGWFDAAGVGALIPPTEGC